MKTVGELLKRARVNKQITVEKLSQITRIDPIHIDNLEKDNYLKLPSPTFIKGFIRNISIVLGQNPDELIAIFRRDYRIPQPLSNLGQTKKKISLKEKLQFNSQFLLITLAGLVFVSYLAFQLRAYLTPPRLKIIQPPIGAVVNSPIIIEGVTDANSSIQIEQETVFNADASGYFITNLSLPPQETEITITSTNRFGKTVKKTIPITVLTP